MLPRKESCETWVSNFSASDPFTASKICWLARAGYWEVICSIPSLPSTSMGFFSFSWTVCSRSLISASLTFLASSSLIAMEVSTLSKPRSLSVSTPKA